MGNVRVRAQCEYIVLNFWLALVLFHPLFAAVAFVVTYNYNLANMFRLKSVNYTLQQKKENKKVDNVAPIVLLNFCKYLLYRSRAIYFCFGINRRVALNTIFLKTRKGNYD